MIGECCSGHTARIIIVLGQNLKDWSLSLNVSKLGDNIGNNNQYLPKTQCSNSSKRTNEFYIWSVPL